ncbi:MAG: hypothetical protein GY756_08150 [bacterium]|nr:hypothetical protein [bacterium]
MKKSNKFGYLMVVVAASFIIGALLLSSCSPSNKKVDKAGQYVLKVLKVKYDKDFVINKGHYITNTGGYEFTVHPKNDPDFTFNAWLNGMTASGESDEYFMARQFYATVDMVKPYINSISKDNYFSSAAVEPESQLENFGKMVSAIHNNNYSISQMLLKYPGKISINLQVFINCNITPLNKDSVLKKVYRLLKFLRGKKFGYIEVWLLFYNYPNQSINELGNSDINFSLEYPKKAKYTFSIYPENVKKINNYRELKKYLREVAKINLER